MAAPLNFTSANVTLPDGTVHEGVAARMQQGSNLIRLTKGMTVIAARDDVKTNVRERRGRGDVHVVTFEDGTVWEVAGARAGCKPCGR